MVHVNSSQEVKITDLVIGKEMLKVLKKTLNNSNMRIKDSDQPFPSVDFTVEDFGSFLRDFGTNLMIEGINKGCDIMMDKPQEQK